ncbi:hypothetical protein WG66_008003 [Moniliophthora roreri]|uniref:Uncharacterized protein n=1 Tax=Moniliophthora roreri TaxID=221103 RepID=A0A0W0FX66_MONRR|nr:hypothetical protein WG66_008003 [Moniliophthora roreri]
MSTRFQTRALRLAQLEKEQQAEDAQALKVLISTSPGELKNVQVPWADLDGLTWTGSKLRKATEKRERKGPYSKERRVVSEQKKTKKVSSSSLMKTSTSTPAFGEITNTNTNTNINMDLDNDQTIRPLAPKIRVQLRTTALASPMLTITPPLVVPDADTANSRSKYDSYFGQLLISDIESRERGRRRGQNPVKEIWEQGESDKLEPEPKLEYTGGVPLSRTPSFSYRDNSAPLVVINADPETITEEDMDTPRPDMFARESEYFTSSFFTSEPDPEATIRSPSTKKSRPLLVAPGPTTPVSAVFPLSFSPRTTTIRPRAKSNADSKPPVSLGLKRAKTLSLSTSLYGPRPMLERRPTPIPGVVIGVGWGKRKRVDV